MDTDQSYCNIISRDIVNYLIKLAILVYVGLVGS
jgi:hypothetical protein